MNSNDKYSFNTAIAIVVANMVGTGVFTSLGFQLANIQSGFAILALWAIGGLAALCGALSYAELGVALTRSGGEYHFLTRIYHPAAGFVSGWVSAMVGFAAPIALVAITFSAYALSGFELGDTKFWHQAIACALVVVLAGIHAGRRSTSGGIQQVLTLIKIAVIVAFCFCALFLLKAPQPISLLPVVGDGSLIASNAFAISLIYVSFSYTGWNAATYLSGEIENPQKNLPKILGFGTLIVTCLYVALNATFLKAAPVSELVGQVEIGYIAARGIFGEIGGNVVAAIMAGILISTVSAMTIAGPRVLQVIGEDFHIFRKLAKTNRDGIPSNAIYFQTALALFFILTSSFEQILVFAAFTVSLNSFFTVLGVLVLRRREPDLERPFKVIAYPLTPLIYLSLTAWILFYVFVDKPMEALMGLSVIAVGGIVYVFTKRQGRP